MPNLLDGVILTKAIEPICPKYGYHVALTGGCLYGEGHRKDIDILFYRIRQCHNPDHMSMFKALEDIDLKIQSGFGWCYKAIWTAPYQIGTGLHYNIDIFFPEETGNTYEDDNEDSLQDLTDAINNLSILGKISSVR